MQTATAAPEQSYVTLTPGDPAPWFFQSSGSNPHYALDTVAGRYIVLCFYASAADPQGRGAPDAVLANRHHFDDIRACFFDVSLDPGDEREGCMREAERKRAALAAAHSTFSKRGTNYSS